MRLLRIVLLGWTVALALALIAGEAGLRLNTSPSVPPGVYWLTPDPPPRGAYVAVCPPPSAFFDEARARGYLLYGRCTGGYSEMIKVLAARPGDRVRIGPDGVRVGERLWPSSAPLATDEAGRPLPKPPIASAELDQGAVLVMSRDSRLGFDGRYFGLLPSSSITATAVPLLTW